MDPTITNLDDGCVKICLGTTCGTVSSHHLIEPKLNQLKSLRQSMKKLTPEQQVKLLRTTPLKPGAQDLEAMQNRQITLDALYHLSGRDNPHHTLHGLYTGLAQHSPSTLP